MHANHVGDGKVGKWPGVLTPERAKEIVGRTVEYCEAFGYDVEASAAA